MTSTQITRNRRPLGRALAAGAVLAFAGLGASGCSNAGEGLISGAGLGAISGLIIGSTVGDPGAGAAIGAAIGGGVGAVVGDQNERNAQNQYYRGYDRDRGYDAYEHREYRHRAPRRTYYEYEEYTEYRYCR